MLGLLLCKSILFIKLVLARWLKYSKLLLFWLTTWAIRGLNFSENTRTSHFFYCKEIVISDSEDIIKQSVDSTAI